MPQEQAKQRATLAFTVRRRAAELVGPAKPTLRETKRLSDLDDLDTLRVQVSLAFFYRGRGAGAPGHPAGVIRRALREALVHYYPLAGRLREIEGRKLVVDCTGEGVLFVEADADVRLVELEAAGLRPPFPCMDQLLFDVQGSSGVLGCPLVLVQVTRLLCGGFVFALRHTHTMFDAAGISQFMNAVAELARGLPSPTVVPAWSREKLDAPTPSFPHRSFDHAQPPPTPPPVANGMVLRSFTFGPSHIAAIKQLLSPSFRHTTTTFEALAAFIWRARTAALEVPSGEDAVLAIIVNFRHAAELALPAGYYGNAVLPSNAVADAAELRSGSLADAVALVRLAKAAVTVEYVRSTAEELVLRGRPSLALQNTFLLSDLRRSGFHRLDFGWGDPVFGGPANTTFALSYFISIKDGDGEDAVAVPLVLPWLAMERFAAEMDMLLPVSKL
ncbi:unnamed protein product [Alopecurus aequalis]